MKFSGLQYSDADLRKSVITETIVALKKEYYSTEVVADSVLDRLDINEWRLFQFCADLSVLQRISFKNSPPGMLNVCAVMRAVNYRVNNSYGVGQSDAAPELVYPEFFAVLRLNQPIASTYIQPASFWARVEGAVSRWTVTTGLSKSFKKKYQAFIEEPSESKPTPPPRFFEAVAEVDDMFLEIHGKTLIAGFQKSIEVSQALTLVRFLRAAAAAFNQEL